MDEIYHTQIWHHVKTSFVQRFLQNIWHTEIGGSSLAKASQRVQWTQQADDFISWQLWKREAFKHCSLLLS